METKKNKIAFHDNTINLRGSSVAMFDYAHFNETLLGNKSIIVLRKDKVKESDIKALLKFVKRFKIFIYENILDFERILEEEKCSFLYCIKYGTNDGIYSKKVKTIIHCVFDMSDPHGDIYSGVSRVLANKFYKTDYLPHMISLKPDNRFHLKQSLGIKDNDLVFGRYGGMDTFNIEFCWNVIERIVNERTDIYFVFVNTPQIKIHKNIIYLNCITEENEKNAFINTCDAFLECGTMGHTFGLSIGEFSVNNKPIIAYLGDNLWNCAHIDILREKGIYFRNEVEFYNILNNFNKNWCIGNYNAYEKFTPELIMEEFHRKFLEEN
jgi:hypothetical protein